MKEYNKTLDRKEVREMRKEDIKKVHKVIKKKGDDFWKEKDNEYLFNEIVNMLNEEGYDLQLVEVKK